MDRAYIKHVFHMCTYITFPYGCCSLGQTNGVDSCSENLVPLCFCTILDTEGHQMGIKYSMEGFIKYLKINTVGNSKGGFIDHNASGRSLILLSVVTIADDNMQDQHCSCITGYD